MCTSSVRCSMCRADAPFANHLIQAPQLTAFPQHPATARVRFPGCCRSLLCRGQLQLMRLHLPRTHSRTWCCRWLPCSRLCTDVEGLLAAHAASEGRVSLQVGKHISSCHGPSHSVAADTTSSFTAGSGSNRNRFFVHSFTVIFDHSLSLGQQPVRCQGSPHKTWPGNHPQKVPPAPYSSVSCSLQNMGCAWWMPPGTGSMHTRSNAGSACCAGSGHAAPAGAPAGQPGRGPAGPGSCAAGSVHCGHGPGAARVPCH